MQEDLNKLIDQHLPNLVGDALKKKLAQGDKDAADLKLAKEAQLSLERQVQSYREQSGKWATNEAKEKELATKEQKLALDTAVLAVRQEVMNQRLADNKELVLAVFANSKYKYQEFGSMPVAVEGGGNCSGYVNSHPYNKTIEVENGK